MLDALATELEKPDGKITACLGGGVGSGKTALACQLALAIASGGTFLEAPCAKGRVLICSVDAGHGYIERMLDKQEEMLGIHKDAVADTLPAPVDLSPYLMLHFEEEAALAHIREVLEIAGDLRCIVLDADCGPSATVLDGLLEDTRDTGTSLVWPSARLTTKNRARFTLAIDETRRRYAVKELHVCDSWTGSIDNLTLSYNSPTFSLAEPEPLSAEARLAEQIRTARCTSCCSVYEAAGKLDVSVKLLERWETGLQVPSALELKRISDTFEVPLDELLN